MNKYIIKNCPATTGTNGFCGDDRKEIFCRDCTDCTMKKIVDLCKQKIEFCKNCSKFADVNIDCVECDERGEATLGRCILSMLEIEECGDDIN